MTLITRHFLMTLGVLVALSGLGGSIAHAIPASSNPNGPSTSLLYAVSGGVAEIDATVSYDPNAGPWTKQIVINDESFGTGVGLPGGGSFTLIEHITIDGAYPFADWHEVILTDYFTWGAITVEVVENGLASPLGHSAELAGNDTELSLFFDDLLDQGTELLITKVIVLDLFAPLPNGEPFKGTILIEEYPTIDEPAAMLLFGVGLFAFGLARRRLGGR